MLVAVLLAGNPFSANIQAANPPGANASPRVEVGAPASASGAPLGVTYGGWRGDYGDAVGKVAAFKDIGFRIVSFVPTYAYVGLNRIDLRSGPEEGEFRRAIENARRAGLSVVIKPHLDPPMYRPGFNAFVSENTSWRVHCAWRGFFDVDPMSEDYRTGIVFGMLRMLKTVFDTKAEGAGGGAAASIRLELGAELMNSVVYGPERWEQLLAAAKIERHRLGLDGKVLLSHNFTHHFEIQDDFVGRMSSERRSALGRYIRGLDALSLSQYMDLTAALPKSERGQRLPTADEVARALVLHEKNFRQDILQTALGLKPDEIPPLHIGEFGVGRGGLMHPNLWDGAATPEQEHDLTREITRGHEGLLRYLALKEGRTARSAILWVTGPHYDVFGWGNPDFAIPEAATAIKAGLRSPAGGHSH